VKSAIFGRDPNWGRIAAAAGRAGVPFEQENLRIQLGEFLLMEYGQPLPFARDAASQYLKQQSLLSPLIPSNAPALTFDRPALPAESIQHPVMIQVIIGNGPGSGKAWGCDLSYDYVKINAEYTT
jgi:glutamate N-acetyltransferase / amino-acid N-acetyltransferase